MASKKIKDTKAKSFDIEKAYRNRKYIVAYKSVYQPFYSVNAGYYAMEVYHSQRGNLTMAGRFLHYTGDSVNELLGKKLLRNL